MSSKEVILDSRGDIRLRVGKPDSEDGQITFLVCSRALARVSPVFDRMLYGNFAESKANSGAGDGSGSDWTVTLLEDKPQPMHIFLELAHANFQQMPKPLSVDEIYDLTVLTNYYDCTQLVVPWMGMSMPSIDRIMSVPTTPDSTISLSKMLWVTWELGLQEAFNDLSRKLLMESAGQWSADEVQMDVQTPPDILERIDAIRTQTFQALLDILRDMVETLIVVDERPRWCHHASWMGPHRCESMILGSITFCLARAGLWPLPEAREVDQYSVLGLYSKLTTSLVIHDIGETTTSESHRECNPRAYLLDKIRQTVEEIPSPLTAVHTEHLERQSAKLRGGRQGKQGREASEAQRV